MPQLRPLGSTGLEIAPLVLGGNVFGWTADEATSFAVLDRYFEGGGTMVDTADVYSNFVPGHVGRESETVIGKWMAARGNRDTVQIATKIGLEMPEGKGLGRDWIERGVEMSLRALQTDHIDLFYSHWDDPDTPQEETAEAFDRLVKSGKVRAIAASNMSLERFRNAHDIAAREGLTAYSAFQPWFNIVDAKEFAPDLRQYCIDNDIGVLTYWSLASGFLTGTYRTAEDAKGRVRGGRVRKYLENDQAMAVLAELDAVAAECEASVAQVSLAWIAAQPGITAPIASATSVRQVDELLGAMTLRLTPAQNTRLTEASNRMATEDAG